MPPSLPQVASGNHQFVLYEFFFLFFLMLQSFTIGRASWGFFIDAIYQTEEVPFYSLFGYIEKEIIMIMWITKTYTCPHVQGLHVYGKK